jgi:hypothetical protein
MPDKIATPTDPLGNLISEDHEYGPHLVPRLKSKVVDLEKEIAQLTKEIQKANDERDASLNLLSSLSPVREIRLNVPIESRAEKQTRNSTREFEFINAVQLKNLTSLKWKPWIECFAAMIRSLLKRKKKWP